MGECFSDHIRTLTSSADDLHFLDLLHGKRTKCLGHYLPQQFIIGKRSGTGNDDPSFHISHHLSRNGRILPQWSSTGHYLQHCSHAGGCKEQGIRHRIDTREHTVDIFIGNDQFLISFQSIPDSSHRIVLTVFELSLTVCCFQQLPFSQTAAPVTAFIVGNHLFQELCQLFRCCVQFSECIWDPFIYGKMLSRNFSGIPQICNHAAFMTEIRK